MTVTEITPDGSQSTIASFAVINAMACDSSGDLYVGTNPLGGAGFTLTEFTPDGSQSTIASFAAINAMASPSPSPLPSPCSVSAPSGCWLWRGGGEESSNTLVLMFTASLGLVGVLVYLLRRGPKA